MRAGTPRIWALAIGGAVIALALFYLAIPRVHDEPRAEDPMPAREFREQLADPEASRRIEAVRIEPLDRNEALYVVTYRDRARRSYTRAEFPGTLTRQLYEARVPYGVEPPEGHAVRREQLVDATTFRARLEDREEVARIERIRIERLGANHARYAITMKTDGVVRAVYAEYPGELVARIEAAGIPFTRE